MSVMTLIGDDCLEENAIKDFEYQKLLKRDQGGRRIALLGQIRGEVAILVIEKGAFAVSDDELNSTLASISGLHCLGQNDVYHWYLATETRTSCNTSPNLKVTLFHPATEKHVRKYSEQKLHVVNETPEMYQKHVKPFIERERTPARLRFMHNICAGEAEASSVVYRSPEETTPVDERFVIVPDLNWDQSSSQSLHLLVIVVRHDLWTVRDLKKKHIPWLLHIRAKILQAVVERYTDVANDEIKIYMHYLPSYFHLHLHVVHAALDNGTKQGVGKAVGLEMVISQLQSMAGGQEQGMESVLMSYTVGEEDGVWTDVIKKLPKEEMPLIDT